MHTALRVWEVGVTIGIMWQYSGILINELLLEVTLHECKTRHICLLSKMQGILWGCEVIFFE